MLALQKMGERLCKTPKSQLARMTLSEELRAALDETARIKSFNALRRHYRRLGKLLRNEALDSIQKVFDEADGIHQSGVDHFHTLERWRDRLLENESVIFGEFLAAYPNADRQHLRQLIQAVQREREKEQPPVAYRKLFRYLREVSEGTL